ncbi:MAG: aminotransferase class I/II-fold pyridoxal phosphate-dependent enzyme [Gammaproteobacteria bacterium]|nr:aminotransferase class I/II-fold pyridoxal phosphate-dependent enzyme [Gammaproteobacteria bacterium]
MQSKLPRVGTTIFTVMSRRAEELGAINLSQGFPDYDAPEDLRELLVAAVRGGHNQYPPMAGIAALREQLALDVARRYQRTVSPEAEVTIVPGATEAIFCAIHATVRPGDEVLVLDPCYDSYEPSIQLAGGRAVHVPLVPPRFAIDWQRVRDAVTPRTRLIITNTPHNPTGTIWSAADLHELEALVEATGIYVIADEVYEHLVYDGARHQSVLRSDALYQRSFAIFSFGKTYQVTGWKTGYCIAPPALSTEFRKVHQFVTFVAVAPIQHALAAFMQLRPEYSAGLPGLFQAKRDLLGTALRATSFRFEPAAGTFFQLLDYRAIADRPDTEFVDWLIREHGVAAIPISVFCDEAPDTRLIRLCFAKRDDTLQRAAARLARL